MKTYFLILVFSFFLFSCEKEKFEIVGKTEEFTIKSMIVKDDYPIFIFLPSNYNSNVPNRIPTASSVLILTHFLLAFAFKKSNGQIHRI